MDYFSDLLVLNLWFRVGVLLVIGLCIGSFLNVVIYRLPIMLERKWHKTSAEVLGIAYNKPDNYPDRFNLLWPSSSCLNCSHKVKAIFNFPLVGYFLSGGKCSWCKAKISFQYPMVELFTGLLFGYTGYLNSDLFLLVAKLVFISICICIIVIDLKTFLIPDELTKPLLWVGLLVNLHGAIAGSLIRAVLGAVVGFSALFIINYLYKLIAKRDGMGDGDFIFFASILAWLGLDGFIPVLLIAPVLGIISFIFLLLSNRVGFRNPIPFGPFLGISGIFVLLFSQSILKFFPF